MRIEELLNGFYHSVLVETVFDVLNTMSDTDVRPAQRDTLMALVMFVLTNNQRPGIMQLSSFYLQDNAALYSELKRLSANHPKEFSIARAYVMQHGIEASKRLVQVFFANKQNNADLVPQPARPVGPILPQRPVGGDKGKLKMAGR